MARMRPDDRREAIVEAALAVMRRQGIGATTVRDIATELGTSSGLIHHYFATMDELIGEAFARAAGEDLDLTIAAVATEQTPIRQLRAFLDSYSRADDSDSMQLWLDAWAEAVRRPALQAVSRDLNERWQHLLLGIVRGGAATGDFLVEDANASAWRILSLLDGLLLQVAAHGDVIDLHDAHRWARCGVERELGLPAGHALSAQPLRAAPPRGAAPPLRAAPPLGAAPSLRETDASGC